MHTYIKHELNANILLFSSPRAYNVHIKYCMYKYIVTSDFESASTLLGTGERTYKLRKHKELDLACGEKVTMSVCINKSIHVGYILYFACAYIIIEYATVQF